ncbi:MAG: hypothetical protein MUQ65_11795 [Armatimonadetes bacterium]|nr:hypothetical protein [Armatimonadota bacterium]
MGRIVVLLAIIGAIWLAVGMKRSPEGPPAVLDVPGMVTSGSVPGRGVSTRTEGRLSWADCANTHFSYLEIASFGAGGRPEVVTGEFVRPVEGRAEAMYALGADDTYEVTHEGSETVVHVGGPFEEFTLYRTEPYADEYSGFWAATHIGIVNLE